MTIDYKHPVVLEIKRSYTEAQHADDEAHFQKKQKHDFSRNPESGQRALDTVRSTPARLAALRTELQNSTDLSDEDRNYYLNWMKGHVDNVNNWVEGLKNLEFEVIASDTQNKVQSVLGEHEPIKIALRNFVHKHYDEMISKYKAQHPKQDQWLPTEDIIVNTLASEMSSEGIMKVIFIENARIQLTPPRKTRSRKHILELNDAGDVVNSSNPTAKPDNPEMKGFGLIIFDEDQNSSSHFNHSEIV